MPRIRTIKPEFFISDTVTTLPIRARLTWIGLWTHCDDYGRCRDNVKLIKAAVWPLDNVSLRDITEDLDALHDAGLLLTYEVDGRTYLQVTSWTEHQKVDRPSKSPIPAPNGKVHTRESLASPRESLDRERKGKEGKGREAIREPLANPQAVNNSGSEPPLKCPEHLKVKTPPRCGPCKDARIKHEDWLAERTRRTASAPKCAQHPDQLASNCAACRSERIGKQ